MPTVFSSLNEGSIVALSLDEALPAALRIENLDSKNLIITSFRIDQSANVQFSPSLQDTIYVYSFGDKMGHMVINGVAFYKTCSNPNPFEGMKDIVQYYTKNGVSQSAKPVFLSFGSFSVRCFLTGYSFTFVDPKLNLIQFQLVFAVPARVSGDRK